MKWSVIPALLLVLAFGGLAGAQEAKKEKKRTVVLKAIGEDAPLELEEFDVAEDGDLDIFVMKDGKLCRMKAGKRCGESKKLRIELDGDKVRTAGDAKGRMRVRLKTDGDFKKIPEGMWKHLGDSLAPEMRKQIEKAIRSGRKEFDFEAPWGGGPGGIAFGGQPGACAKRQRPGGSDGGLVNALEGLRREIAALRRDLAGLRSGGGARAGFLRAAARPTTAARIKLPAPPRPPKAPKAPVRSNLKVYRSEKVLPGKVQIEMPKAGVSIKRIPGEARKTAFRFGGTAAKFVKKAPATKAAATRTSDMQGQLNQLKAEMKHMKAQMAEMLKLLRK